MRLSRILLIKSSLRGVPLFYTSLYFLWKPVLKTASSLVFKKEIVTIVWILLRDRILWNFSVKFHFKKNPTMSTRQKMLYELVLQWSNQAVYSFFIPPLNEFFLPFIFLMTSLLKKTGLSFSRYSQFDCSVTS